MMLGNPWGLLALASIPVILGIHLYRRRYTPVVVTGLFLFDQQMLQPSAGRNRDRLRRRTSLLLEIIAALACVWFLCDPHWNAQQQGVHHVVIVDTRRSLQGFDATGTALTRAHRTFAEYVHALNPADRLTVLASGNPPRVLIGPALPLREYPPDGVTWAAEAPWHDVRETFASAVALATDGTMLFISDRPAEQAPAHLATILVGTPINNIGLVDVRWLRDGQAERLTIRAQAFGTLPTDAYLHITCGDQTVVHEMISWDGDQTAFLIIPLHTLPADVTTLTVDLATTHSAPDGYPDDNAVTVLRPDLRTITWYTSLTDELSVTAVTRALAANPLTRPGTLAGQLYITNSSTATPGAWTISIRPGHEQPVLGPFLMRRGDPVLRDLDASGVLWSSGIAATACPDEALMLAGDTVLLSTTGTRRQRHLTLWTDLKQSTLTDHPLWPSLWANIISECQTLLPGVDNPNPLCGQSWSMPLPETYNEITLTAPSGRTQTLRANHQGMVTIPGLPEAGCHHLTYQLASQIGSESLAGPDIYALPLDARLSNFTDAITQSSTSPQTVSRTQVERERSPKEQLLPLLIAALAAAGAWWIFRREESS